MQLSLKITGLNWRRAVHSLLSIIQSTPNAIVGVFDWLVQVTERLIVLGIACVIFYMGWIYFRGIVDPREEQSLPNLPKDWRIFLVLLIPLFYQSVKALLKRVTKIPGLEMENDPPEKRESGPDQGE